MSAVVEAPAGRITGRAAGGSRVFLGIPYGRPPVGALRWRPPEPAAPGIEIDATRPGPAPPQIHRPLPPWAPGTRAQPYAEDCLNLDIYAPARSGGPRPVIVHAFGGGFQGGSAGGLGIDGARFAATRDCILVRVNMRTGALGFLHLAEAFPGLPQTNRGMLDLILALTWVRDNIAAFGGDPGRVTLAGLSSGAFTATALFGCPEARGLFHAAWLMSGPASRIVAPDTAAAVTRAFLDETDVPAGDIGALERLPVGAVLAAQEASVASDLGARNAPGGRTLGIVQDGASLARHPRDALQDGAGRDVGIVFGCTAQEARMWYAAGIMGAVDEARLLQTIRRFEGAGAEAARDRLRAHHPDASPRRLEERYLSDVIYRRPVIESAEAQRRGGGQAATYCFQWAPAGAHAELGASHGFDEPFVFDTPVPVMTDSPADASLRQEMSDALLQLARTGRPGWAGDRVFGDAGAAAGL
ncbi:carboxylesterase family protein [Psychromarinibacter sp. C21-152]|uniref:Carboxylic ester hydrolase n=1 Tax=Psychromarinibacter sediminicola TaxID=3033385 RepID=A0AAE3TBI1_9RHOB|nr:carboxylesterase family protein [Psychromarinibacter sediminicola]MDF0603054.1 carboxylesterase family protein [Psychromarinibacter sediminicola]